MNNFTNAEDFMDMNNLEFHRSRRPVFEQRNYLLNSSGFCNRYIIENESFFLYPNSV